MEAQERARCKQVVERTTPAQLKVLRALARGLHPTAVADELHIALATVNSHCTSLFYIPTAERFGTSQETNN